MPALSGLGQISTPAQAQTAGSGLANNFDTFLTLLTEQLKNQDPLSPLDSTEFVGQLVQFSNVEQQINQNRNLESLISQSATSAATSAVAFIGKTATVLNDTATLQNGAAQWDYTLPDGAVSSSLIVKDAGGKVVFQTDGATAPGAQSFVWDGRDNAGNLLADGAYTLEASALDANNALLTVPVSVSVTITGADFSGDQPVLQAGSLRLPFSQVLSVSADA